MTQPTERISICQATTINAPLKDAVRAYAAAGASGIGLWEEALPADDGETAAQLESAGLRVTHCIPRVSSVLPGQALPGPRHLNERIEALTASIRRFARFSPVACVCLTGPSGDLDSDQAGRAVVEGLRAVAGVAEEHHMRLAIEPCNPDFAADWSIVDSIESAARLVDAVGVTSLGLLVDVWHLWADPNFAIDVARNADYIVGVHVGDRRSPTRSLWDRVIPGEGVADLGRMIGALDAAGFTGWYDVEVFSDDGRFGNRFGDSLWLLPPDEIARRAVAGLRAAIRGEGTVGDGGTGVQS
jgi:sugar phosphate isomerase/epimerase